MDNNKSNFSFKELAKAQDDKWIFGICGGFGKHTPIPSWLWRAIFIIAIFANFMGLIAYIVLAFMMPRETVSTVSNPALSSTNPMN